MLELAIGCATLRLLLGPTAGWLSYDWLDARIVALERVGRTGAAAIISLLLLCGACAVVQPLLTPTHWGICYAALAQNPFALDQPSGCAYRRLTPLLSYCLGLRGDRIVWTNLLLAWLLIASIYAYFRRTAPRPGDAFFAATTMTFSMVTYSTLFNPGYCDTLTYLLVFVLWRVRSRARLFYPLFLLCLLNREGVAFLVPWFAFLAISESTHKRHTTLEILAGYGTSLGLYVLFRAWVASHTPGPMLDADLFVAPLRIDPLHWVRRSFGYWGIGAFSVFKLLWAIPLVAMHSLWQTGRRRDAMSMLLLLGCALAQLVLAFDTSRLLTLSFMVMVVALLHLFETDAHGFRGWVGWLVLGNLAVPDLYTAENIVAVMRSPLSARLTAYVAR
ncbi:MAG: hypothetical protein ACREQL_03690 [Candidatus Binatia bacterium]